MALCSVEEKKKQDVEWGETKVSVGVWTDSKRMEKKTLALPPPLHPGMAIAEGGRKMFHLGRTGLIRGGCTEPFQTLFEEKNRKRNI